MRTVSSFGSFESAIGLNSASKFAQETACCHVLSEFSPKTMPLTRYGRVRESFLDSAGKLPTGPTDKIFVPRVRPTDRTRGFQ
jgi:hypothetical protein